MKTKYERIMELTLTEAIVVICLAILLLCVLFLLSACGGQTGQGPQMPAPQTAKTYAQPTLQPFGQPPPTQPQSPDSLHPLQEQPEAVASPTLIQERPKLLPATPSPESPQIAKTADELVGDAYEGVIKAQELLDDCYALQSREFEQGWIVNCLLLEDNLAEANRRMEAAMKTVSGGQP